MRTGGGGKGETAANDNASVEGGRLPTLPRFWNSDCRIAEAPEAGSEEDWACRAGESNPRSNRDASVGKQAFTGKKQMVWEASQWR